MMSCSTVSVVGAGCNFGQPGAVACEATALRSCEEARAVQATTVRQQQPVLPGTVDARELMQCTGMAGIALQHVQQQLRAVQHPPVCQPGLVVHPHQTRQLVVRGGVRGVAAQHFYQSL